ncbi:hypothetical protein MD484_g3733, partial [Candolleomyces efflorescens]
MSTPTVTDSCSSRSLGYDPTAMSGSLSLARAANERPTLRAQLEPYTHYDVDLNDFAVHVLGIDENDVASILELELSLDEEALGEYNDALQDGPESLMAMHFCEMVSKLLVDVAQKAPHLQGPFPSRPLEIWQNEGIYWPSATGLPRLRPDVVFFIGPPSARGPTWSLLTCAAEFKRHDVACSDASNKTELERVRHLPDSDSFPLDRSSDSGASSDVSAGATRKRKRNLVDSEELDDDSRIDVKRQRRTQALWQMDLRVSSYVQECFASTSRYYVVSLVIINDRVTVLYVDRMLCLQTTVFSFQSTNGIKQLALIVYGISVFNRRRAGFDPHLHTWPPRFTLFPRVERPVETLVGSYFEFKPQTVKEVGSVVVRCEPEGKDWFRYEAMVPWRFRISSVIRTSKELIGRATVVYDVQEVIGGSTSEEHYALKMSWPPTTTRGDEIQTIKHLHSAIPELADHLPALHFSKSFTAKDLNLPWTKMSLSFTAENHQERVLRVLVETLYTKLWKAGSVEAFKQAWLDCVECHFQAWEEGNVLHRDLSENNLMLFVDKHGQVKGVLNDWDMASFRDPLGKINRTVDARHRTGTPRFMAIDLLWGTPNSHLYRHELESVFYILLWGALHYDLEAGVRLPTVELVAKWVDDPENIANAKSRFFYDSKHAVQVLNAIRPEFQDLRKDWIEPLYRLFRGARRSVPDALDGPDPDYDYDTYGGRLSFWTFMEAIKQTPRWAKKQEAK